MAVGADLVTVRSCADGTLQLLRHVVAVTAAGAELVPGVLGGVAVQQGVSNHVEDNPEGHGDDAAHHARHRRREEGILDVCGRAGLAQVRAVLDQQEREAGTHGGDDANAGGLEHPARAREDQDGEAVRRREHDAPRAAGREAEVTGGDRQLHVRGLVHGQHAVLEALEAAGAASGAAQPQVVALHVRLSGEEPEEGAQAAHGRDQQRAVRQGAEMVQQRNAAPAHEWAARRIPAPWAHGREVPELHGIGNHELRQRREHLEQPEAHEDVVDHALELEVAEVELAPEGGAVVVAGRHRVFLQGHGLHLGARDQHGEAIGQA
mmetsp:Transcript_50719/g.130686  ORF Transcript_50719/g.130686 Transcript_50719/m.130686 type:complete len:321 (-) Transcript_50719:1498-2460(-)